MIAVPKIRITSCNDAPVRPGGGFVLYWMIASRRVSWNFALDRAIEWALQLAKPLVILEALRSDYPWASDRLNRFVLEGMWDNARALESSSVSYYAYVETVAGEGKGLLKALADRSAVVVTDEFPCFFLPHMVASAAKKLPVLLEQVDSNGLAPLRMSGKAFTTAYSFRRFLQKELPTQVLNSPQPKPFAKAPLARPNSMPREITGRWPRLTMKGLETLIRKCASDEQLVTRGGAGAGQKRLKNFVQRTLHRYAEDRNTLGCDASSGLSPHLHFGNVSAHQIFAEVAKHEDWSPEHLALRAIGSRTGWWGMSESAEAFLDQVVTWRELGFNLCHHRVDYDQYESLPEWAKRTLEKHARDQRAYVYSLQEFENAATHDPLWNAAQTQLVTEGRIYNYLRMLWGKKVLEWTRKPEAALEIMIELNNKYALDGRDPNSYSGIFWCMGRYDRPWGPERPIFGTVRYMSSENTARKMSVTDYIRRYQPKT